MEIKLTQRVNPKLRKLTNQSTNEVINVEVDEVEGNVLEYGTSVIDVLENLNFRDETKLEFTQLSDDSLPSANNHVQLILKANGELWCIPPIESSAQAFKINDSTTGEYLAKKGVQFASGSNLTYYNTANKLNLFATRARLGAIPARVENIDKYDDGTYIDFNNTGAIKIVIDGEVCHELTNQKVEFSHNGGEIRIDGNGRVFINTVASGQGIFLEGAMFAISSGNTYVEEAEGITKFNCHTNLGKASYGNSKFRLQFYEDFLRIRNVETETDVLRIYENGSLEVGDEYLKSLANQLLPILCQKTLITDYVDIKAYYELNQNTDLYEFAFSDTEDGEIMKIVLRGTDIDSSDHYYMPQTGYYYRVRQYIAQDDSEDTYIEIRKENAGGYYQGDAYIRSIYKYNF